VIDVNLVRRFWYLDYLEATYPEVRSARLEYSARDTTTWNRIYRCELIRERVPRLSVLRPATPSAQGLQGTGEDAAPVQLQRAHFARLDQSCLYGIVWWCVLLAVSLRSRVAVRNRGDPRRFHRPSQRLSERAPRCWQRRGRCQRLTHRLRHDTYGAGSGRWVAGRRRWCPSGSTTSRAIHRGLLGFSDLHQTWFNKLCVLDRLHLYCSGDLTSVPTRPEIDTTLTCPDISLFYQYNSSD
jgi:hypothetical protein